MAGVPDLRACQIATASLTNDVGNLRRMIANAPTQDAEPERKSWSFAGHQGRRVLVDKRNPTAPDLKEDPTYRASSWKIGDRSTEIHPASGQHSYDTGNLYRTVHWKDETFGLNGIFTDNLQRSGMWRNEGLNCNETRSKVLANPTQWGTPKETLSWMVRAATLGHHRRPCPTPSRYPAHGALLLRAQ